MVAFSWKHSRGGLPLIPNGKLVWFTVKRLWCCMWSRPPFYNREVEPDHKRSTYKYGWEFITGKWCIKSNIDQEVVIFIHKRPIASADSTSEFKGGSWSCLALL
jgi:hypothetical protein